jgi:hypothetical protein
MSPRISPNVIFWGRAASIISDFQLIFEQSICWQCGMSGNFCTRAVHASYRKIEQ